LHLEIVKPIQKLNEIQYLTLENAICVVIGASKRKQNANKSNKLVTATVLPSDDMRLHGTWERAEF